MPYKHKDIWHRKQRAFLTRKIESGRIQKGAKRSYASWLHRAWERLGRPDPKGAVRLADMEHMEGSWAVGANTKATQLPVIRDFLRYCENKDAREWNIRSKTQAKQDRLFLSEEAVRDLRILAHSIGPEYELIFSLGVDNSLRRGDIARMTVQQARDLLWKGQSMIVCKGRNGGKHRLLVMSKMTRDPLRMYLEHRDALVKKCGMDPQNLMIREHCGRLYPLSPNAVAARDKIWVRRQA